jgi:serine/threonine protein kinase
VIFLLKRNANDAAVSTAQLTFHPRYIRHIILDQDKQPQVSVKRYDPDLELYPSKRRVAVSQRALFQQQRLQSSKDYNAGRADVFETEECKAQYDWQLASFPTCNTLHEMDLLQEIRLPQGHVVAHGFWRDVWVVQDAAVPNTTHPIVLKTIRYQHEFEERNYDRHRRDAVAMERLTKSKLVVDIYGHCGNSGLFEYANGGTLSDAVWGKPHRQNRHHEPPSPLQILELATQAAMGVAAIHNFDGEGVPSLAHTDIAPGQFVQVDRLYKLNDFNRARFLRWNVTSQSPCGYFVGKNPGKNRSPEEYSYQLQSEKVDIYSLGNTFYMLLTGYWPFEEYTDEEAQEQVKTGLRPTFPMEIWNSSDSNLQAVKEAMILCHEQEPSQRATARQIEAVLLQALQKQRPNILQEWGLATPSSMRKR